MTSIRTAPGDGDSYRDKHPESATSISAAPGNSDNQARRRRSTFSALGATPGLPGTATMCFTGITMRHCRWAV
ncbi:hypothetical protein GCM10020369_49990 [Cryptosporangium minutisporangium]|uniref:Uncharacterized protein n=1 Tax=Cryptosporangium minutisporangium TaxID=113569 RepID=A0ABP6T2M3_9ACTN